MLNIVQFHQLMSSLQLWGLKSKPNLNFFDVRVRMLIKRKCAVFDTFSEYNPPLRLSRSDNMNFNNLDRPILETSDPLYQEQERKI